MSAKTDDALQSIQNIIAKGMPHKDEMYAVQGYLDMLAGAIAAIKAERDAWKATATKLADQQARHLNLQNHDRVETLTPEEILHNSGAPEEDA